MRKLINIFSMQRDGFQPAQDRRKGIQALNVVWDSQNWHWEKAGRRLISTRFGEWEKMQQYERRKASAKKTPVGFPMEIFLLFK